MTLCTQNEQTPGIQCLLLRRCNLVFQTGFQLLVLTIFNFLTDLLEHFMLNALHHLIAQFRRNITHDLVTACCQSWCLFNNAADFFLKLGLELGLKLVLATRQKLGLHAHFKVTAQLDVRTTASHVRRNRDRARHTGLRDDQSLTLVVTGVQNLVRNFCLSEQCREKLGLLDRCCAEQNRLTTLMTVTQLFDYRFVFLFRSPVDDIIVIDTLDRAVRWNVEHAQTIRVHELVGFCVSRTGHAREFLIEAEIVLVGDGRERLVFRLDRDAFFGFDRLVQTF